MANEKSELIAFRVTPELKEKAKACVRKDDRRLGSVLTRVLIQIVENGSSNFLYQGEKNKEKG